MHQLVQLSVITLVVPSKYHSRLLHALNSASVELRRNPLPMSISVRTNLASTSYVYLCWTTENYVARHPQDTALLVTVYSVNQGLASASISYAHIRR